MSSYTLFGVRCICGQRKKVTIYVSPNLFPKVCSLLVCNTQPISERHGLNSKAKTKMFLDAIEYGLDAKNNLSLRLIIFVIISTKIKTTTTTTAIHQGWIQHFFLRRGYASNEWRNLRLTQTYYDTEWRRVRPKTRQKGKVNSLDERYGRFSITV